MTKRCNVCNKAISESKCPYCKAVDKTLFQEEKSSVSQMKVILFDVVIVSFAVFFLCIGVFLLNDTLRIVTVYYHVTLGDYLFDILALFIMSVILIIILVMRIKKRRFNKRL